MKTYLISGFIAVSMLLCGNTIYAQIPVQWERTLQFEGVWTGDADLNLGGQLFNVFYTTDFRLVIDGSGMTMDEGFSDPALGELKGANLIGYSPYDDQIHWFSVDNFGTAHEHTGSWLNPKHFYMVHQSIQNGLVFAEYIHFRLRANNTRMAVKLIATLGPDTIQTIEGILYRQPDNNRTTGIAAEQAETALVYPNPANGIIYIECDSSIDLIRVMNEAGQQVYEAQPGISFYEIVLDTPGMYFLQVVSDGNSTLEKVIVEPK